jgi:cell division protease FtsH
LIAFVEKEADPLHKVSIIPRGMALGVTQQLPISDKYTYSKIHLEAQLAVLFGGRGSEEIFLDTLTTGAGSDFEKATGIARKMVCEWGMSSLGPMSLGKKDDMIFLGREMVYHPEYSEDTARLIDSEVKKIIEKAYQRAKKILMGNKTKLEEIAALLLERESLSFADIEALLGTGRPGPGIKSKGVEKETPPAEKGENLGKDLAVQKELEN